MNRFIVSFVLLLTVVGGCHKVSEQDAAKARRVVQRYTAAWLADDVEAMYHLTSARRVRKLTGIDPSKGSAFRKRAFERFVLVARQTRDYMGYVKFKTMGWSSRGSSQVVFKVKAWHDAGKSSILLFRVTKGHGGWKID
ncbi:MAG: hypothetical protein J7M25_05110 [Deltaproteobacteria bacterium]|nr:hypothetical protein [Deltaproteobacteria bacterium]